MTIKKITKSSCDVQYKYNDIITTKKIYIKTNYIPTLNEIILKGKSKFITSYTDFKFISITNPKIMYSYAPVEIDRPSP